MKSHTLCTRCRVASAGRDDDLCINCRPKLKHAQPHEHCRFNDRGEPRRHARTTAEKGLP